MSPASSSVAIADCSALVSHNIPSANSFQYEFANERTDINHAHGMRQSLGLIGRK